MGPRTTNHEQNHVSCAQASPLAEILKQLLKETFRKAIRGHITKFSSYRKTYNYPAVYKVDLLSF
jgi:adenylylsulfate kinase-like enzyme